MLPNQGILEALAQTRAEREMNQVALSSRARRILDYLLRLERPVSTSQIASRLRLSDAQVRYCFDEIDLWLGQEGFELIRKPRIGTVVAASPAEKEALLNQLRSLDGYSLVLEPEEREQLLLLRILTADDPLGLSRVREELAVSRTTLFRDLSSVRAWLQERGLGLDNRRGDGVFVTGPEVGCRQALLELLSSALGPGLLIAACLASDPSSIAMRTTNRRFLEEAHNFLNSLDLREAERLVAHVESQLGIRLVDEGHARVVLSVALVLQRVPAARWVQEETQVRESDATAKEADAAWQIAREIEGVIGQELPDGEVQYLMDTIVDALEMGFVTLGPSDSSYQQIEDGALEAARLLASTAGKYLHPTLLHDQELIECLALELGASRWGLRRVPRSGTPRITDGRATQGPLCRLARRALVPTLESQGYVADNRLLDALTEHISTALERTGRAYPQRRVWIICAAGVATARNLVARLNLQLPELGILGVASAFEVARDPGMISGADAVISTIPLECIIGIPVLLVSAALTSKDVQRIKTRLSLRGEGQATTAVAWTEKGPSIVEILSPDSIVTDARARSWEEVIDLVGELLLQDHAVWPSYVEAMKDIVRLYGPYVVVAPGAALLHAGPEMGGRRLAMSLTALDTPVPFGHETHDPVRLALAFSSVDHRAHVRAVGQAIDLLSDEDAKQAILAAASKEKILEIIEDVVGND